MPHIQMHRIAWFHRVAPTSSAAPEAMNALNPGTKLLAAFFSSGESELDSESVSSLLSLSELELELELEEEPIIDRKSTRLNSSHSGESRMPSSA